MIKPCLSNFGENDFFFVLFCFFFSFFVTSNSDFVLTKFCMSVCKDVLLTEPCNLHDLYSRIDSNECFYVLLNISLFWNTRFNHLCSNNILLPRPTVSKCAIWSYKAPTKRWPGYKHVHVQQARSHWCRWHRKMYKESGGT